MLWESFLVGRAVPDKPLRDACGGALGIAPQRVRIVERIEDAPPPGDPQVGLVIERTPAKGQFPLDVTLYVTEPSRHDSLRDATRSRELLVAICRRLCADCLISDDSPDPYTMLLVRPDGGIHRVELDPERLDADEEYVVAGVVSVAPSRASAS